MGKSIGPLSQFNTYLLIDWDEQRNLPLTPADVSASSNRKVWWLCHVCGYSWNSSVNNRAQGRGCPFCAGKAVWAGRNDILTTHPEYVQWWDDELDPRSYSAGSRKEIHWKCRKAGHRFVLPIKKFRLSCPQCIENPLSDRLDDIRSIFSDSNDVLPQDISYNSAKRVIWTADCGHEWQTTVYQVVNHDTGCPICSTIHGSSRTEDQIAELLSGHGLKIKRGDKSMTHPFEIDIFLPEREIAIEFNGLYWHTEDKGKDRWYHFNKWKACRDAGIQLITIWEDDWKSNRTLMESMLMHKLGVSEQDRIFARKLSVVELSAGSARGFCDSYHIQGFTPGSIYLGLIDGEGDIQAVSIWIKRSDSLYLERYCTKSIVIGGMGKMLSLGKQWGMRNNCSKIVTFSDHCVSDGGLYERLGFTSDQDLSPDYSYLVGGKRVHKFNYRVSRFRSDPDLVFKEGCSERELARLNGIPRIWDCGKTRWVLTV